jgi:predicted flavoprotein YhiN
LVTVLEAGRQTLTKVKISGGGRCNVLHDTSLPTSTILSKGYPRGQKELKGIYHKRFTPTDARAWFEERGVTLKTEPDGRMFPISDNSQTIMDALLHAASNTNNVSSRQL